MRSESEIQKVVLDQALTDERVRAVLLNGSRANPNLKPDQYQDFDLVFVVRDFNSFIANYSWVSVFGEKLLWQLPDEMSFGNNAEEIGFHYLMLFTDGNRIDLTLFPIEKIESDFETDSLTIVWLDKDALFSNIQPPSDKDYHICKPTEKEFLDACNEFWWVITYVAKGLAREEITYAKEMLETIVRPMFMKIIERKIGCENNFAISFGKAGKHMKKYLMDDDYNKVLTTYADFRIENNWKSLFVMIDLFGRFAIEIATQLKFPYNHTEQVNAEIYLKQLFKNGGSNH